MDKIPQKSSFKCEELICDKLEITGNHVITSQLSEQVGILGEKDKGACNAKRRSEFVITPAEMLTNEIKSERIVKTVPQGTPFGLNKYVLLFFYVLYTSATARVYFSWSNLSNILFRAEAYIWLCNNNTSTKLSNRFQCVEQDSAVQLLFIVACSTAFCSSLLNGYLLDMKGPKLTAIWGQILNATGWFLLAFSGESCRTYIPAMIFMGLGADAGFLPAMSISALFPNKEKFIIGLISAAMSVSFVVPLILEKAWLNNPSLSLRVLCCWYACCCPCLGAFVAFFLFPLKSYVPNCNLSNNCNSFPEDDGIVIATTNAIVPIPAAKSFDNGTEKSKKIWCCTSTMNALASHEKNVYVADKQPIKLSLRQQLCSKHFWAIYIYWPLNAIFYPYYSTSGESLIGKEAYSVYGILEFLSVVPSILLGIAADAFGVMYLIAVIICSAFFMYAFAMVNTLWSSYTSAVFAMLYVSCFSGQLYSYVNDTFEPIHFGKIVGLVSATGGLLSLLRNPIHTNLSLGVFKGNFTYTCIIMLILVAVCFCIVVFLFFVKRAQPKAYLLPINSMNERKTAIIKMPV